MAVKIHAEKFTDKWTKVETKYLENRYWGTLDVNFPVEPMQSHIISLLFIIYFFSWFLLQYNLCSKSNSEIERIKILYNNECSEESGNRRFFLSFSSHPQNSTVTMRPFNSTLRLALRQPPAGRNYLSSQTEAAQKRAQDAFTAAQRNAGKAFGAGLKFLGPVAEKAGNMLGCECPVFLLLFESIVLCSFK